MPMQKKWHYLAEITDYNPDYVCVSIVTKYDYHEAVTVSKYIKERGFKIIVGGVYPRGGAEMDGVFDYVCRGEAEQGLVNFLKNRDISVFKIPERCKDISTLPLPDYSGITGYEFDRGFPFLLGKKIIPYSSSRGCPYQCNFCEIQKQPKGVRIKNTIRKDLLYIKKIFNPELIQFIDELIPYYSDRWCEQLVGNKTPFMASIRADISEEKLTFLIKNGLYSCAFGIESGDERYRNEILKKNLNDSDIYRTVSILNKFKIFYIPFYIENTPKESKQIKKKTKSMIDRIGGYWVLFEYENLFSNQKYLLN